MAKFNFNNMMQGAFGNMSEQSVEELEQEYGAYLFDKEEIQSGYRLIRDAIVFTNLRILFIDKQGATGRKTSFKSIYLSHIVDVEMETAGAGIDDSEITVTYMKNTLRTSRNETLDTIKFEFPKKAEIVPLYKMLGNLVIENRLEINQIVEK